MPRKLKDIISELPADEQEAINARYLELKVEVENLQELRQKFSSTAQAKIAKALNIKQPSVSKIEQQSDMLISTFRRYVHAIGGELDLSVRMPTGATVSIRNLGDLFKARGVRAAKHKRAMLAQGKSTPKRTKAVLAPAKDEAKRIRGATQLTRSIEGIRRS
jgi:hypothetical protein